MSLSFKLKLSVVIPAKNEMENVEPFINEVVAALGDVPNFEIVYVDDGSTDGTFEELLKLKQFNKHHLTPLRFRRYLWVTTQCH